MGFGLKKKKKNPNKKNPDEKKGFFAFAKKPINLRYSMYSTNLNNPGMI